MSEMSTEKRLIDANAVDYENIMCSQSQLHWLNAIIEKQPTVDAVEVVHGRWENVKETEVYSPEHRCTFTHTAQTCSVCNVRIGFIGAKFYLYDGYCPNCGAKMDGDGNG